MVDFLFALGQGLFILGLLYGAYLSITYRKEDPEESGSTAHIRSNPVMKHVGYPAETRENQQRPDREDQGITVSRDGDDKGERRATA